MTTTPHRRLTALCVLVLLIVLSVGAYAESPVEQHTFNRAEMVPMNALSLGDAALVAPDLLKRWGVETGQAAELISGDRRVEVLLFPIDRPDDQISLRKSLRDRLGVKPGKATVALRLLKPEESTLPPLEWNIRIEGHEGAPTRWPGIVLGAPHSDCDMYTGEIVEQTTRQFGIPSVCAYGGRIAYLGRWIDVNRPLQRRPNADSYGILPYRDWTDDAWAVFSKYRDQVLHVGRQPDRAEGSVPLDLYLDFHGHDLTVTAEDGKKIYRSVFECMARGFTRKEVRVLKREFDRCVEAEYGDEAPPSYWGNLLEDRNYEVAGRPATFYYSGLGARVYGTLASYISRRAIHIESPDLVRIPAANRPKTARVLGNFLQAVRDQILRESLDRQCIPPPATPGKIAEPWVAIPAGDFRMGAPDGEGWSIEWPQHWVKLSAYQMAATEVTCGEYARFVNEALYDGDAVLQGQKVYGSDEHRLWCVLWPEGNLAMLERTGDQVRWREGREHHPVNYVTWYGAEAMARASGARLPHRSRVGAGGRLGCRQAALVSDLHRAATIWPDRRGGFDEQRPRLGKLRRPVDLSGRFICREQIAGRVLRYVGKCLGMDGRLAGRLSRHKRDP